MSRDLFKLALCTLLVSILTTSASESQAQDGIEQVILEKYFVGKYDDHPDSTLTTYRIFIDLKEGYRIQALYGNEDHPLSIVSTGTIFNEPIRGNTVANRINHHKMDINDVFLDSYLTIGSGANSLCAVLKSEDNDGSIIPERSVELKDQNTNGDPIHESDGLMKCLPIPIETVNVDEQVFHKEDVGSQLILENGAWATLEGYPGPTEKGQVLVAQITTNGELSFVLNAQIVSPTGEIQRYVASNPQGKEIVFPGLSHPQIKSDEHEQ